MLTDELIDFLFDGQPNGLAQVMGSWLTSSRRFATFSNTFRDKIRKKLRNASDSERSLDLRLELETAYLLLGERALSVVYEPQTHGTRGPDFAVTYTTSLTFTVEVTRVRATPESATDAPSTTATVERLADTIGGKLGQLLPQHGNVLLVGVDALRVTPDDLRAAMLRLQQRAERGDAALFQRVHLRDRSTFFAHLQRLSEVVVRPSQAPSSALLATWTNAQARHPLSSKVRTVVYRALGG